MANQNASAPSPGKRVMDTLQPLFRAALGALKMDRDVISEVVATPPPLSMAVGLLVLGAGCWGLGFHSWRVVVLRPLFVVLWVFATHAMARRDGGKGTFPTLLRAFALVTVVDLVALLGALGQLVAPLANLYLVVIMGAMVEADHDMGPTPAVKSVLKGLGIAMGALVLLAFIDAGIRGQYKWGTKEGDTAPAVQQDRPKAE